MQAEEYVDSVLVLAVQKEESLQQLSLHHAALPLAASARLIAGLPSISLDLSQGGVETVTSPTDACYLDPNSRLRGLDLSGADTRLMQMWSVFPALLVKVDFSGMRPGSESPYGHMVEALKALSQPIALQEISVASVPAGNDVNNFTRFVSVLLLSGEIKLRSLDITGCLGGNAVLQTLGQCLRINRTLAVLKMDGQRASLEGWEALRGCLYGNKKLVSISYPWIDCGAFFDYVAVQVDQGWSKARSIKSGIGRAHRAGQWGRKQQLIEDIKACKRHFMTLERNRVKSVRVLQAIFQGVEANAAAASATAAGKAQAQLSKPHIATGLDKTAAKQVAFLAKLKTQLPKLRAKLAKQSTATAAGGGSVGGAGGAGSSDVQVPSEYAQLAQQDQMTHAGVSVYDVNVMTPSDGKSQSKFHGATQVHPTTPTARSGAAGPSAASLSTEQASWRDVAACVSSGPQLFVPAYFAQFCALLDLLGGRGDAALGKLLCDMQAFIAQCGSKVAGWGLTHDSLAAHNTSTKADSYSQFAGFHISAPAAVGTATKKAAGGGAKGTSVGRGGGGGAGRGGRGGGSTVVKGNRGGRSRGTGGGVGRGGGAPLMGRRRRRRRRRRGHSRDHLHDDPDYHYSDNGGSDCDDDEEESDEQEEGEEGEEGEGDHGDCEAGETDDAAVEGEEGGDDADADAQGEEGDGAADADGDGADEAMDMYAGAGPRDLPDGGGPDRRSHHRVLAGPYRTDKSAEEDAHLWPSPYTLEPPAFPTAAAVAVAADGPTAALTCSSTDPQQQTPRATEASVAKHTNTLWQRAIGSMMDAAVHHLAPVLEYECHRAYHTTTNTTPTAASTSAPTPTINPSKGAACYAVTQCSLDRLPRLEALARAWGGAVSAAVYIPTGSSGERKAALAAVRDCVDGLTADASYTGSLVVSVLFGHENSPWKWDDALPGCGKGALYPINALRNLAAAAALAPPLPSSQQQQSLLFLVDVDFVPSAGLCEAVSTPEVVAQARAGTIFVVPAFERSVRGEAVAGCAGEASKQLGASLSAEDVCVGMRDGSITPFHVAHFAPGHKPTNYDR